MKKAIPIILTDAQKEYRKNILKPRVKIIQNIVLTSESNSDLFIQNKAFYLNNCIFWFNEYLNGNRSIEKFDNTLNAMQDHISEIKTYLKLK